MFVGSKKVLKIVHGLTDAEKQKKVVASWAQ
jgi:hypothetical protein